MRTLIVGQAPSRDGAGTVVPFSGRSGQRLARLIGCPVEALPYLFELSNLLEAWPGKAGRGDAFDLEAGRRAAWAVPVLPGQTVVLAGRQVARCFGLGHVPFLTWVPGEQARPVRRGARFVVLPHPSGLVTWWNDPAHEEAARQLLRRVV